MYPLCSCRKIDDDKQGVKYYFMVWSVLFQRAVRVQLTHRTIVDVFVLNGVIDQSVRKFVFS